MTGPHLQKLGPLSGEDEFLDEGLLLRVVDDPVVGLLPWILMTLAVPPWGFETGMLVGFVSSLALVGIAMGRGERPRMLESADAVLFGALVLIGLASQPAVDGWLNNHCDEVSNAALALLAFGSVALDTPFTEQYSRYRLAPLSLRVRKQVDKATAIAWGLGFSLATIAGGYGEWVINDSDNLWTGWILQTLPLVWAYLYTRWLDRRALATIPEFADLARPVSLLVRDCAAWTVVSGLLGLAFGPRPDRSLGWLLLELSGLVLLTASLMLARRGELQTVPATGPGRKSD
ncbi:MAG: hypothetical protein NTY57_08135 [Solirubrobacterales bacterium]|nr:hypothetical protein [Solirubrobacterales bacterium]